MTAEEAVLRGGDGDDGIKLMDRESNSFFIFRPENVTAGSRPVTCHNPEQHPPVTSRTGPSASFPGGATISSGEVPCRHSGRTGVLWGIRFI
jgi:hypothetical protein